MTMRRIPILLIGLTLLCCAAQPVLLARGGMTLWSWEAFDHGFPLLTLTAATGAVVGGLILSRHPWHRIGWLFVIGQLGTAAGQAAEAYGWAVLDGTRKGSETLAHLAAWFANTSSTSRCWNSACPHAQIMCSRRDGKRWSAISP